VTATKLIEQTLSHREEQVLSTDDSQLIAAFQAGEYRAFDTLYRRYAPRVLGFAFQLTGDRAEAEDLTQEVFIAAFKGMHRFRSQSRVLTWLLSIALRRRRDGQRSSRLETVPYPIEPSSAALSIESTGTGTLDDRIESVALFGAIGQLEAPLRDVFLLVVVQELTYREAAQALDCPLGTIKWRVARALRQVRAALTSDSSSDAMSKEEDRVSCLLP